MNNFDRVAPSGNIMLETIPRNAFERHHCYACDNTGFIQASRADIMAALDNDVYLFTIRNKQKPSIALQLKWMHSYKKHGIPCQHCQ